jgi:sarcosine oxidase subunit gamma
MLEVLEPCAIARVQSWDLSCAPPRVLDAVWPREVGSESAGTIASESSHTEAAVILCVGPSDWLVLTAATHAAPLMRVLQEAFQATSFRVTDLSSALRRIQLEGPEAATLLSRGCALDLHPDVFTPGQSARTRFAGMPVVIRCTRPAAFECIVSLSYCDYLLAWCADAARETVPDGA